jgi:hypothetical protein
VKKSIWPKSKLTQNVCRRPSDRLLGILPRLFLEPKFPHTNFSISSHLPVHETPAYLAHRRDLGDIEKSRAGYFGGKAD